MRIREILYEERDVKIMMIQMKMAVYLKASTTTDICKTRREQRSTFVDNRPKKFGGQGSGFRFANIPVIKRYYGNSKEKYSWRKRVEEEEKD